MKRKTYAWLFQSLIIFIFLSIYWGGMFFGSILALFSGVLISMAGIVLLPFSILSDSLTKRFSPVVQLLISFVIHVGISLAIFLAAQGWILALLYGFLYWVFDLGLKKRKHDNKKTDQIG